MSRVLAAPICKADRMIEVNRILLTSISIPSCIIARKTLSTTTTMAPPPPSLNLLGPPELYNTPTQTSPTTGDPFMDAMVSNFNSTKAAPSLPPMGLTENNSPTFLSSGNPCVDFFFHVVPDTPAASLNSRLQLAWTHNSLTSLKLICNLRGVRGTGKTDKEGFYKAAFWLQKNHPKTLACNVGPMADFGYYKDLPEILYRFLEGYDVRAKQKAEWLSIKPSWMASKMSHDFKKSKLSKEEISALRNERRMARAKKGLDRYIHDPDYRFLHERISDHFADKLKSDLKLLESNDVFKISMAAKWCPSINSSFDYSTLLCESIARKVFPRELYPEYEGIEEAHYAYRVRARLQKHVLVPLRKAMDLPEIYMSNKQWELIPYERVASVAMKLYTEIFMKHDKERFEEFLGKVKKGEAKIAAGALLPHEIIFSLKKSFHDGQVAELQWNRIVEDLSKKGKLKNCMAICDVSGSMSCCYSGSMSRYSRCRNYGIGTPLDVSVTLGLLVSELSEDPWKGKLITFSAKPVLHVVQGDNLRSKISFVERMDWMVNTDFQKVFDVMLEVAVNKNLSQDEMIKRLFVFSDMEFDEASANDWETDYQAITRKFSEKGYTVPEIVFWNLRDSKATPVPSHQKGVALVSGFSKNLLKLFLNESDELNPEAAMEAAIAGEEYNKLVVVD